MHIKRLHILYSNLFSQRDYDRFGVDVFLKKGFEVFIWDLTPLLHKQYYSICKDNSQFTYKNLKYITTKEDLKKNLNNTDLNDHILALIPQTASSHIVFNIISKKNTSYSIAKTTLPKLHYPWNADRITTYLTSLSISRVKDLVYKMLKIGKHTIAKPTLALACGGIETAKSVSYANHVALAHSFDYEKFRSLPSVFPHEIQNTAVFIDEALPTHPDSNILWKFNKITEEFYYPIMNTFFDWLESSYNLNVVICAHPRSNYKEDSNVYGNRKIIKSLTPETISKSKITIAHMSTAISYAVLYKKPIVLLQLNEMSSFIKSYIKAFSNELNCPVLNLNDPSSWPFKNIFNIDLQHFSQYKENHLKSQLSEEQNMWEIFIQALRDI